jgi:hypothetical protein
MSTFNGVKTKRRLNISKSNLAFFHFGSAHDKNGPAVPGRTPDRVKRSIFCGPRSITNLVYIVFVVYAKPEGTNLKFHDRAPLPLPRFNFRGKNKSLEENKDCLNNGASPRAVRTEGTVGQHLQCLESLNVCANHCVTDGAAG